jgi:hypothetical protein
VQRTRDVRRIAQFVAAVIWGVSFPFACVILVDSTVSVHERVTVLSTLVPFTLPTALAPLVFLLWPSLRKKTTVPCSTAQSSSSRVNDKYGYMLPLAAAVASDDASWERFISAFEQNGTPKRP